MNILCWFKHKYVLMSTENFFSILRDEGRLKAKPYNHTAYLYRCKRCGKFKINIKGDIPIKNLDLETYEKTIGALRGMSTSYTLETSQTGNW